MDVATYDLITTGLDVATYIFVSNGACDETVLQSRGVFINCSSIAKKIKQSRGW